MCTLICTITICTCTCDTCMYSADMYSIDMYNHDTCACTMYVRTVTDVQLWHHIELHQHSLHVHCPVLFSCYSFIHSSAREAEPQGGTCMYRHWRRGEGREERGWKGRGGEGEGERREGRRKRYIVYVTEVRESNGRMVLPFVAYAHLVTMYTNKMNTH